MDTHTLPLSHEARSFVSKLASDIKKHRGDLDKFYDIEVVSMEFAMNIGIETISLAHEELSDGNNSDIAADTLKLAQENMMQAAKGEQTKKTQLDNQAKTLAFTISIISDIFEDDIQREMTNASNRINKKNGDATDCINSGWVKDNLFSNN